MHSLLSAVVFVLTTSSSPLHSVAYMPMIECIFPCKINNMNKHQVYLSPGFELAVALGGALFPVRTMTFQVTRTRIFVRKCSQ